MNSIPSKNILTSDISHWTVSLVPLDIWHESKLITILPTTRGLGPTVPELELEKFGVKVRICKNLSRIQYFFFAGASQVLLHNGTTSSYGRAEGEAAGYKVI